MANTSRTKPKRGFARVVEVVKKGVENSTSGRWLGEDVFISRLPGILVLVFLTILYIGHSYYVQHVHLQIIKTQREISKLAVTAATTKANRITVTKESYIIEQVEKRIPHLKEIMTPPETFDIK